MSLIRPILDLTRNAWKKRHGDLDVYGTWFWDGDDRQWVPCLVIVRAISVLNVERSVPCIIPLDHAWAWSEEQGGWEYVASTAVQFCEALRLEPSARSIFKIVDLVRSHLEDLIKRVPPRPADDQETTVRADVITKINGRSEHREVRDRV